MSYDELRGAIARRHRALSGRLQQIAEFVLDHPTEVALGTVAEVAQRSGVQPSAIVRFAHALGFGGFTEMQQVFRSRLVAGVAPSYKARLARMKHEEKSFLGRKPAAVLARFVAEAQSALVALSQSAHARELDAAIGILGEGARHLSARARRLVSGRRAPGLCAAQTRPARGAAGRHRRQHPRAIASGQLRGCADRHQLPQLQSGHRAAVSRTRGAQRAGDFHHRQPAEPDRRGREVVFEIPDMPEPALRTMVAPMCLVQAWPSASISRQTDSFHIQEKTSWHHTTPRGH